MKNKLKLAIIGTLSVIVMSVATFAYNFNSNEHLIQETNLENEIKLDKETESQIESKKITKTTKVVTEDKAYSDYAPYGLTYEEDENKLFYNGKSVRYFADVESTKHDKAAVFLSFGEVGDIDVFSVRDDDNNLTGLRVATKEEFDENTKGFENNANNSLVYIRENVFKEKHELEEETKAQDSYSYNYNSNSNNSKLDFSLYSDYGDFSYNKDNNVYTFNNKPIRFFYDEKSKSKTATGYNHNIFIHNDHNAPEGVMIRIVRNSNGDIENLIQMTEEETENFIDNTKSLGGMTLNSKAKQNSNTASVGATGSTGELKSLITQYEPYGFAYQQNEKKYFYNGKSVRCFIDIIDASNGSVTIISEETGDIDVFGVRDDNNNLTGLRIATKEEYDNLTTELTNNDGSLWGYVRNILSKDKSNSSK